MPSNVPRKRNLTKVAYGGSKSQSAPSSKRRRVENSTVFDAADSVSRSRDTREANNALLEEIENSEDNSSSDTSDHEFEDALYNREEKPSSNSPRDKLPENGEEDDEESMEFENVMTLTAHDAGSASIAHPDLPSSSTPTHLELTLDDLEAQPVGSLTNPHGVRKGPSKIERQIRIDTHRMHVQFLLFHNVIRNGWACDKAVQKALQAQLTQGVQEEIERWRKYCGDALQTDVTDKRLDSALNRKQKKSSGKTDQLQRDWGRDAEQYDDGTPNLSRGDPTIRLLKVLSAFWRKKFRITAPGIRKQGYKDIQRLDQEVKASRKTLTNDPLFGERIQDREAFRLLAQHLKGSRDVGAQLFTALVRSLRIETRLVASLQPVGFSWTKNEDALPPRPAKSGSSARSPDLNHKIVGRRLASSDPTGKYSRHESNAANQSESELSSALSSDDLDSDPDVKEEVPSQTRRIDKDLPFPVYWTEVLSPISGLWIPVDPLVLNIVAYKPEQLHLFESRGAKAERSKQVFAYVVAFSADGTAKDVTVRYLKKHMWPGKTKGSRIPIEKIPVYNKMGKVKRYEEYDWFKNVMRSYGKDDRLRTAADEIEDANELQAVRGIRDNNSTDRRESLQMYKQHTEFVLERFLKRDEALIPKAQHVKLFTVGKGEQAKNEPVYRRKDVAACKTVESWHKEGREVKAGEKPLKMVPVRAVTLLRKREIEEEERETGEKAKQGLYARYQTDWIIPPPIKDGIIPKNTYGNIDVYVPSMVPKGAVHIPLRGSAKICKQLEVNFAEACTGFEFGNKMAVPVIVGVVVATENEDAVIDAWQAHELQKQKREAEKREKTVLGMWKKMYLGLKVIQRFRNEYGNNTESHMAHAIRDIEIKTRSKKLPKRRKGTVETTKLSNHQPIRKSLNVEDDETDLVQNWANGSRLNNELEIEMVEGGFFRDEDSHAGISGPSEQEGGILVRERDNKSSPHIEDKAGTSSLNDGRHGGKVSRTISTIHNRSDHEAGSVHGSHDTEVLRPSSAQEWTREPAPEKKTRSRRAAAEKGMKAVRSHFFDDDNDGSSDNWRSGKRRRSKPKH